MMPNVPKHIVKSTIMMTITLLSHSDSFIPRLTHTQTDSYVEVCPRNLTHTQPRSYSYTHTLRFTHSRTYSQSDALIRRLTRTQTHSLALNHNQTPFQLSHTLTRPYTDSLELRLIRSHSITIRLLSTQTHSYPYSFMAVSMRMLTRTPTTELGLRRHHLAQQDQDRLRRQRALRGAAHASNAAS